MGVMTAERRSELAEVGFPSRQCEQLAGSMPKIKALWVQAIGNVAAYEFIVCRSVHDPRLKGLSRAEALECKLVNVPAFPRVTSALRASHAIMTSADAAKAAKVKFVPKGEWTGDKGNQWAVFQFKQGEQIVYQFTMPVKREASKPEAKVAPVKAEAKESGKAKIVGKGAKANNQPAVKLAEAIVAKAEEAPIDPKAEMQAKAEARQAEREASAPSV